jgi:hypothetical protein
MAKADKMPVDVVATIVWDEKSKKVGKLLERLADAVEAEVARRLDEELDQAFDEGYALALREVERFGLDKLLKRRTVEDVDTGNEGRL